MIIIFICSIHVPFSKLCGDLGSVYVVEYCSLFVTTTYCTYIICILCILARRLHVLVLVSPPCPSTLYRRTLGTSKVYNLFRKPTRGPGRTLVSGFMDCAAGPRAADAHTEQDVRSKCVVVWLVPFCFKGNDRDHVFFGGLCLATLCFCLGLPRRKHLRAGETAACLPSLSAK